MEPTGNQSAGAPTGPEAGEQAPLPVPEPLANPSGMQPVVIAPSQSSPVEPTAPVEPEPSSAEVPVLVGAGH